MGKEMTAEQRLQKLHELLDEGQTGEAAALIDKSSEQFAEEPRALLPLLDSLDRQRKTEALLALLAKLKDLDFLPLECAIFELRVKFRDGAYPEALRLIDKILGLANESIEALRTGGRIGNLTRDESLALRYWERLAKAAPNDPEAALQAARIHLRRGQHAQALAHAQQAAERQPDSAEPLQIAIAAGVETDWPEICDPLLARLLKVDRTRAVTALSRLVQELDSERAARLLSFLQQQIPNDSTLGDVTSKAYSGWLVAALEQELASRELDAAAYYRAARIVQPRDANAQRALDRLSSASLLAMREAFNGRDFPGAVEHGLMATRINPDAFEAWQTIGRAQFTRGNTAEASDAFRRCTELNPKDANSWLMSGLAMNQAGERRRALLAFQKAQGLADSEVKKEAEASISALHPLLVRDAQQAATNGNFELAWETSDAVLAIRPGDAGMKQLRQNLLRQQKEQIREAWNTGSDSSVGLCRRYLEKAPGDTYVSTVLGRTLMRTRAYAEALPIWESLSRQAPEDSHNHLQVARCCRSLRIRERGLAAIEAALRLDPNLQEATEMVELLKALPPSEIRLGAARR
jgi:tetratricopeptide (TPR) repeat protein